MGKKKRYRGHYCWMCESILSNESFSGRGHRDHICKKCKKLPRAKRQEKMDQDFLFNVLLQKNISKGNQKTLEEMVSRSAGCMKEKAEAVLLVAQTLPRKKKRKLRKNNRALFDELVRLGLVYDWSEDLVDEPEHDDYCDHYDCWYEMDEQRCLELDTELRFLADQEDLFQLLEIANHSGLTFFQGLEKTEYSFHECGADSFATGERFTVRGSP